ncbi:MULTISPECIES: DegT/DnrJ/EryC1/StrS family aminotransferase [Staphylococcus]|uniref:Pyridoxal phosphate-dependent aminotransferase EpsN n=1 Tax=Staphylococcus simulans TaxID=1286 RepID=A0A6N3ECP5_STASI|nr:MULTISPECIES: aminotransferase class I/II-fold pyridoxal phosphate-dependent enzyme [Staphylococcus]MDQ7115498.1 aminotransferase class I/II-fold pyridoxal phosphate-dependent enzyme [Staphylococcus simulans]MDQ7140835.1 aminotransferase class I/II-fold pyridoxal phosphate-dependent enzyme [Staphylococcus simulans]WML98253.1 aminotransferase class I/II-fold pyridoxal phosphate-dependent enzyme [Staphylococcus simulans]WMM00615.1 aminotransferase class I/II-fold pyridoxal phosphate-dependent 
MIMRERIFLSTPHMGGTETQYIEKAFKDNWIAPLGENVTEFENDVKDYVGADYALATASGTSAIHLALIEAGVAKGDIVFCSSLTFCATSNPILYQDATPVFIDSEMESWNMSPTALEKAFKIYEDKGTLPKAVLVVNLYGQTADFEKISEICKRYDVTLIEDSAESLGSTYHGKMSGSFGDLSIFSFNGNKIITTSGGGMLLSNHKEYIDHALFLATQAKDKAPYYQHSELGFNYRLSNISAGIGRGQMEVINDRVNRRRDIFDMYYDALSEIDGINFQPELPDSKSNRWLTAMTIDSNKINISAAELIKELNVENIEARAVWKPMHLQPLYESFDYVYDETDNAEKLFEEGICLPSGSNMTNEQVKTVIERVKAYIES